jgi:hypothetical protein
MYNRSIRRQGARTLAFLAVALGLAACGDSPTGQVGPETLIVEFEASGVVERDGQPVCGAKVVLMRCERMGTDGCEEEVALAIAMTNSDGEYALRYSCVCDPTQEMPEHSMHIEMPAAECVERLVVNHDFSLGD